MIYFGKPPLGSCNLLGGCFQLGRLQMPRDSGRWKDLTGMRFCKVIRHTCSDMLITKQQKRTLIGQAKNGDLQAAMRGLQTIMER